MIDAKDTLEDELRGSRSSRKQKMSQRWRIRKQNRIAPLLGSPSILYNMNWIGFCRTR